MREEVNLPWQSHFCALNNQCCTCSPRNVFDVFLLKSILSVPVSHQMSGHN
jgi:hypothetical protein